MYYDTVICGSGLAGLTAALVSLSQGKKTAVVAQGESSLYYISGYLDLCGNSDNPWAAIDELIQGNPEHPFAVTNAEEIRAALDFFVNQTKDSYPFVIPGNMLNTLVPTCTGNLKYTYLVPDNSGADRIADPELRALAVGFTGYRDYSAQLVVDGLNSKGYKWTALEIDSGCPRKNQNSIDLASYLDDAYPLLLEKLKTEIKDYQFLVFPAVLGLKNHLAITEKIKETFGIPVFEVPTLPPSLPGIRLSKALSARIHSLGGDMFVGYPVKGTTITGNKCTGLIVDTPGRPRAIAGENYILATGGIVGEGIAVERGGMKETVFGLPVTTGLVTSELCFSQSHGYAKSGIRVNSDLRPIGPEGKSIYENVFCAGRTLVGYDPFTEFDGAGVAIVTGYKAAHTAIRR